VLYCPGLEALTVYDYVEARFPTITRPDRVLHRLVPEPHCLFCSLPIKPEYAPGRCYRCGHELEVFLSPLEGLVAATLYIPEVTGYPHTEEILQMKATGAHAGEYAWVISEVIRRKHLGWNPRYVLAIPSAKSGTPRPGISTFAQAIARRLNAEFIEGLHFIRTVQSQHRAASREERYSNLANAMRMDHALAGRSVMIVDDVATSLATMLEAARAVQSARAGTVTAAVAGRVSRLETLASLGVLRAHG
jgi:predicted amidophosphoribosyltransferase